jgi:hypothetical protein
MILKFIFSIIKFCIFNKNLANKTILIKKVMFHTKTRHSSVSNLLQVHNP